MTCMFVLPPRDDPKSGSSFNKGCRVSALKSFHCLFSVYSIRLCLSCNYDCGEAHTAPPKPQSQEDRGGR